jgi:putative molybdopterin biosynthesis protein
MSEYFTTRELAALLRVKERKIYDLVAGKALPVRRVTGKLLFPRDEIEAWIAAGSDSPVGGAPPRSQPLQAPLVMGGGHDPLLEWALRDSRCGIAALLDGALDGLDRMRAFECVGAGLHIPSRKGDSWNVDAVADAFHDDAVVLLEWARRRRGLMYRASSARPIAGFRDILDLRFQSRQAEAGSELILANLLAKEGLQKTDLNAVATVERTETDLALAISAGRADIGLGIEAVARQFGLGFHPLVEERFDLLVWRKAYFDPPFQKLIRFCASTAFRRRAEDLGGYDVSNLGAVHFNGP